MLNLPTNLTEEFKRLYHGRGEEKYKFLTIDSIDKVLFVQFFEEVEEKPILEFLKEYIKNTRHENIIVKRRYSNETFSVVGRVSH